MFSGMDVGERLLNPSSAERSHYSGSLIQLLHDAKRLKMIPLSGGITLKPLEERCQTMAGSRSSQGLTFGRRPQSLKPESLKLKILKFGGSAGLLTHIRLL